MLNIPAKIVSDIQYKLNEYKDTVLFDVQHFNFMVDSTSKLLANLEQRIVSLKKVDIVPVFATNFNMTTQYALKDAFIYDGNVSLTFVVDHKIGNEVIDTINRFINEFNAEYLVDINDNVDAEGNTIALLGLRRNYKTSIGVDGIVEVADGTRYQTYIVNLGIRVTNKTTGNDIKFKLLDIELSDADNDVLIDIIDVDRQDSSSTTFNTDTKENQNNFDPVFVGGSVQKNFTIFNHSEMDGDLVDELRDAKDNSNRITKYALVEETYDVRDGQYKIVRRATFNGQIGEITSIILRGRESQLTFAFKKEGNPTIDKGDVLDEQ